MIKYAAHADDRKILAFGISEENVKRLKAGLPIHVFLEEMGVPGVDIVIFYGETEDKMIADLKKAQLLTDEQIARARPQERH